jgi:hypothetical protein
MSTRAPHARDVIAQSLKRLKTDAVRLSPDTHAFVVGRLAAALKSAYPKFNVEKFLQDAGSK